MSFGPKTVPLAQRYDPHPGPHPIPFRGYQQSGCAESVYARPVSRTEIGGTDSEGSPNFAFARPSLSRLNNGRTTIAYIQTSVEAIVL
jgi:hypothetical protein